LGRVNRVLLLKLLRSIQQNLFPWLAEAPDPLTEKAREFVRVAELAAVDGHLAGYGWAGIAVFNLPTTVALLEHPRASRSLRRLRCSVLRKRSRISRRGRVP
jgi:hypothetical protein